MKNVLLNTAGHFYQGYSSVTTESLDSFSQKKDSLKEYNYVLTRYKQLGIKAQNTQNRADKKKLIQQKEVLEQLLSLELDYLVKPLGGFVVYCQEIHSMLLNLPGRTSQEKYTHLFEILDARWYSSQNRAVPRTVTQEIDSSEYRNLKEFVQKTFYLNEGTLYLVWEDKNILVQGGLLKIKDFLAKRPTSLIVTQTEDGQTVGTTRLGFNEDTPEFIIQFVLRKGSSPKPQIVSIEGIRESKDQDLALSPKKSDALFSRTEYLPHFNQELLYSLIPKLGLARTLIFQKKADDSISSKIDTKTEPNSSLSDSSFGAFDLEVQVPEPSEIDIIDPNETIRGEFLQSAQEDHHLSPEAAEDLYNRFLETKDARRIAYNVANQTKEGQLLFVSQTLTDPNTLTTEQVNQLFSIHPEEDISQPIAEAVIDMLPQTQEPPSQNLSMEEFSEEYGSLFVDLLKNQSELILSPNTRLFVAFQAELDSILPKIDLPDSFAKQCFEQIFSTPKGAERLVELLRVARTERTQQLIEDLSRRGLIDASGGAKSLASEIAKDPSLLWQKIYPVIPKGIAPKNLLQYAAKATEILIKN